MLRGAPAACAAALAGFAPAHAQDVLSGGEFFADARIRAERLEDDARPETAHAATARARAGFVTGEWQGLSGLIEAEATAVTGDLAAPGAAAPYPSIGAAGNLELNRLQLMYEADDVYASAGRQLLEFGDERHVGDEDWRQDDRTFDALYAVIDAAPGVELSYAYAWRMNDTYGDAYLRADAHLALAEWTRSSALRLAGFAYLIDLERAPDLSSATVGVRARGSMPLWRTAFDYDLSWARQSDHGAAAGDFALDDISAAGTAAYGPLSATARYQWLEGNGARGVTYPFASRHGQRGWTDLFEHGPASGMEALTLGARANLSRLPAFRFARGLVVEAAWHDFDALNGAGALGAEWNAAARVTLSRNWSAGLSFADFDGAPSGPPDQQRLWLELSWRR